MLSLLRLFWPLCQLQRGPQDLPADPALLGRALLLCWLTNLLSFSLTSSPLDAVLQAFVAVVLSVVIWALLLRKLARPGRQLQTLTAIYGCAALLNLMLLPVAWLLAASGSNPGFLPFLLLGLLVWSQLINEPYPAPHAGMAAIRRCRAGACGVCPALLPVQPHFQLSGSIRPHYAYSYPRHLRHLHGRPRAARTRTWPHRQRF